MLRPFRFAVQLQELSQPGWVEEVRRIEALGYSTIFWPDHFTTQWDPTTALGAVAAVTERVNVGSLVYDVDYRHPVIYAKAAATLHLLSGGRHEFGIGAGWMQTDYEQAGIAFERPATRIERLDEALQIIVSMWSQRTTRFAGKHYQIRDLVQAAKLAPGQRPKLLIGGGGPKILRLAGRHGDIVGISATMHEGRVTAQTAADLAPERVREKVRWVQEGAESAGRDPDQIELNALVFVVAISEDPGPIRGALAKSSGMTEEQVAGCPLFLTGSGAEIRDRLEKQREETGISYVVIQGGDAERVERFAEEIVAPLAG